MTISADRGCFGAGARRSGSIAGLQLGAIGSNLFGQGLLLLPVVGVMAVIRGLFVSIVALLYILFAVACLLGKSQNAEVRSAAAMKAAASKIM